MEPLTKGDLVLLIHGVEMIGAIGEVAGFNDNHCPACGWEYEETAPVIVRFPGHPQNLGCGHEYWGCCQDWLLKVNPPAADGETEGERRELDDEVANKERSNALVQ